MRLSHYRRNFLHRRVMLNYINSHYVRNCLHRNVGFNTFNETEQLRTEFPASSRSANLFIYYLTTMFITKINQLHEIGKDLKWRTTYLNPRHSPSSVCTRLVDVASVPCQENHNYINHNFHIIHNIHSFLYYYSSRNLFYLGIGINLFGSSKLKLWHFHAH